MTLPERALAFATQAHGGQFRKYTGEPYINHPISVAAIVATVPHTEEMLAAAYLHDVVEDTPIGHYEIGQAFGGEVGKLVHWLTEASVGMKGNRAQRKAIDRDFLARAPAEAQTIKLADIIDNTRTIAELDPKFWIVYREEKRLLLEVLTAGDQSLWNKAASQTN